MRNPMKFELRAIAMELIAVVLQAAGIATFLFVTKEDYFQSFVAVVLGLVWLKVTNSEMTEDFADFRLRRHLFSQIGEWMNRKEATKEFDDALARYQMIEGSIENDDYKAVVTATGFANSFRRIVTFLLSCYLIYLIVAVASGS